jgi:hypothetical protein
MQKDPFNRPKEEPSKLEFVVPGLPQWRKALPALKRAVFLDWDESSVRIGSFASHP